MALPQRRESAPHDQQVKVYQVKDYIVDHCCFGKGPETCRMAWEHWPIRPSSGSRTAVNRALREPGSHATSRRHCDPVRHPKEAA